MKKNAYLLLLFSFGILFAFAGPRKHKPMLGEEERKWSIGITGGPPTGARMPRSFCVVFLCLNKSKMVVINDNAKPKAQERLAQMPGCILAPTGARMPLSLCVAFLCLTKKINDN